MLHTLRIVTHSPEETRHLGRLLGQNVQSGDLLLLSGPLGAGKTCLVQGIAFGLGIEEYARSPSFVIATRYRGRLDLYHIDLYRLDDLREVIDLGLEEYLTAEGVCVVEWAEKAATLFPQEHIWIELAYGEGEEERHVHLTARGRRYEKLLNVLTLQYPVHGA